MSKEAMKLALEALEFIPQSGSMLGSQAETKRLQAIAVMKEALVMQQLSEPCRCGKQTNAWCMANTCSKAQQALDKKAENARELGLDYEPAQQEPVATDWERIARVQDAKLRAMCNESGGFEKLCEVMDRYEHTSPQPAQQEPVAHAVISGALFDFMGWLTSRKERLVLSSADNASPAVEAITEFAKMRGLSLNDAKVQDWNTSPSAQRKESK